MSFRPCDDRRPLQIQLYRYDKDLKARLSLIFCLLDFSLCLYFATNILKHIVLAKYSIGYFAGIDVNNLIVAKYKQKSRLLCKMNNFI
jgi:hypothetical protein